MSAGDLGRVRFGFSPLAEVAHSLYMISERRIRPPQRAWFHAIREQLGAVDMGLLSAVVPPGALIADWFFDGDVRRTTTIDNQLAQLADMSPDRLRLGLASVWDGATMPARARELIEAGSGGPPRLADTLADYWHAVLAPYWPDIRAVLDDDVSYRAACLVNGGGELLFAHLHTEVTLRGDTVEIAKATAFERDLSGDGLTLAPSVFAWPHCVVTLNDEGPVNLSYAARGVGTLWTARETTMSRTDAMGDLLGRSRAAIISDLAVPRSTTELATRLALTPPSISQHLAILKRGGLVTSWRSGRRVLYKRTALATSLIDEDREPGEIVDADASTTTST